VAVFHAWFPAQPHSSLIFFALVHRRYPFDCALGRDAWRPNGFGSFAAPRDMSHI
jgi:hypothetical protein